MSDAPVRERGLLDTSVVIDLDTIETDLLPLESAVSTITLAELAAGTLATTDINVRARRQRLVQRVEASFAPVGFGVAAARAYAQLWAAVAATGRKPRAARAVDLLIAATAAAEGIGLWTRNPADFVGLDGLVEIVGV